MRIPPLFSDWLILGKPNSHGIYNSLSPWSWHWHGQSLVTCCDEMESSAHTQQSYTRTRLSLKPGLKIKFAGSELAPRKVVHLLGSWDAARRVGQGQPVSRIQCGASGSLFYMYQTPVEIRDRCCVGKLNILCYSVLIGAIFHRAVQFSSWECFIPGCLWADTAPVLTSLVCHGFEQQELLLLMLRV